MWPPATLVLPLLLLVGIVASSGTACNSETKECPEFCECCDGMMECHSRAPTPEELGPRSLDKLLLHNVTADELKRYVADSSKLPLSRFFSELRFVEVTNSPRLVDDGDLNWYGGFSIMMRVRHLNVSGNGLVSVNSNKWEHNRWLRVLDAGYNQIRSSPFLIDSSYIPNLNWLSLAGNKLDYINPKNFQDFTLLEYLDVSDNVLHTLEEIFDSLQSLQRLNVAGNKLEHVQADWFKNLGKLVELDISRNKLTFIPADTLQPLTSLSVFKLAENPLIERDLSLLLGTGRRLEIVDASRIGLARVPAALTHSVRTLKLVGNQLTSITSGDLDSYPLLKLLDLSNNRLMIIEEDALGRLDGLEELILSGNMLPAIPKSLPSGLRILDLRQNAISKLKANDLQGLHLLKILNLSGNVISLIEGEFFRQLPALEILDISDNPIKKLPSDTLSGPTNLKTLRMSGLLFLKTEENQNHDTAFPILTLERLVTLDVSRSPVLASQLLTDNAALSACKSLQVLDLSYTNISSMRSDLAYVLPQLRELNLIGNEWNCSVDQFWLGEWMRQHRNSTKFSTRCKTPSKLEGKLLEEMPGLLSSRITTTTKVAEVQTSTTTSKIHEIENSTVVHEIVSKPAFKEIPKSKSSEELSSTTIVVESTYSTTDDSFFNIEDQTITSTFIPESITTIVQTSSKGQSLKESATEKNELRTPPSISPETEEPMSVTNEEEWSTLSTIKDSEEYPSKAVNYETTRYTTVSSTPIDLVESNQDKESISTASRIKNAFPITNSNKKVTKETITIASISPNAETTITTNVPNITTSPAHTDKAVTSSSSSTSTSTSTKSPPTKPKQLTLIKHEESATSKHKSDKADEGTHNKKLANRVFSEFSRSKLLLANEEQPQQQQQPAVVRVLSNNEVAFVDDEPKSIAQELSGRSTESGARTSETLAGGAHPGMLILLGAAIGAAAALTVVLSRRATVRRRDRQYQRYENIEVHALTPTTELW